MCIRDRVAEVPVETRLPTAGQDAAAAEREAAELAAKADRWSEKRQSKVGAVAPPNCHNCVIHPLSKLRRRWDFLLFVLLIYCAIIIPFRVGFENEAAGFWLIVETTIDGISVNGVDIITCDDDGRIIEFKVMLRPMKAVEAVRDRMAAMLETLGG